MKFIFQPKSDLEIFGFNILKLLVENFPSSFFVGGTTRDILLKKEVKDIDIATNAKPEQVAEILKSHFINYNLGYKNLGIVIASQSLSHATIASFRKEIYAGSRFPKIQYVKDPKTDSERRDFAINALYLSPKLNKVLDYHNGLKDLKNKRINFIGEPLLRIQEDPLRMLRAIRFAINLNFKIKKNSKQILIENFKLLNKISTQKFNSEFEKIKNKKERDNLKKVFNNKILLDKYLKKL